MIETTLTTLGLYLKKMFSDLDTNVLYSSQDSLFKNLSLNGEVKLPAIAYIDTNIAESGSNINRRGKGPTVDTTVSNNMVRIADTTIVNIDISFVIACASIEDYFKSVKNYFEIKKNSQFDIVTRIAGVEMGLQTCITEISGLSSVKDQGNDYDIGSYHIREGSFKVNSFIIHDEFKPVIRELNSTIDVEKL